MVLKIVAHARDFSVAGARKIEFAECKKSLFHRRFLLCRTMRARSLIAHARNVALSKPRALVTRRRAQSARRVHVSLSGDWFFRCAVVNEMQCVSIRDRTEDDISHVSWLGGQQWRNVERRRQR